MKRQILVILSFMFMSVVALQATNVNYTADNSTIFPNPERGFITMLERHVSESSPYAVKNRENYLTAHANNDKGSLILVLYYLDNYKSTATIPSKVLNAFDEDMAVLRNKGMKAIVRFAYTNSTYENNGTESAADASLAVVQSHINQYKTHWAANADVIFVFQAGIVGAWGEWYYSDNFGNQTSHMNSSRKALVDTLLKAVPQDRCIQLRTPLFKTEYIGSTSPLTASEAYKGTAKARLGHHNDAFLYGASNMGTYSDTSKQKPYLAQETLYVPIGGESDITDEEQAKTDASHDRTIAEMSRLHWTFIQSGYSETVTNMWRENGTFDELNIKLGYRFQLVSANLPNEAAPGGKASVTLKIKNMGFAPLYNERPAYIVLKNSSKSYRLKLAADPRTWLPNGVVSTVSEQLTLPSDIATGNYQLYLYLPDKYESIASNPKYAVRFANSDVWEESTGMNNLKATMKVSSSANPDPDPQPQPSGDAVVLPNTLNKANVSSYSDDMTWYNTDYFDFGPEDNENTDRWAEWKVELKYPGNYIISEVVDAPSEVKGHEWNITLLDKDENVVSDYTTTRSWDLGNIRNSTKWDLSNVSAGLYTLHIKNSFEWAQPKLQSLILEYDGEIPSGVENIKLNTDAPIYDVLGRRVSKDYKGIVIQNGRVFLINR